MSGAIMGMFTRHPLQKRKPRQGDAANDVGDIGRNPIIDATPDPKRPEMLTHMRDLWINLANDEYRIHAGLIPPD
jgi:hypothetical protein